MMLALHKWRAKDAVTKQDKQARVQLSKHDTNGWDATGPNWKLREKQRASGWMARVGGGGRCVKFY